MVVQHVVTGRIIYLYVNYGYAMLCYCCAEFDIIRENINAKNKTTDLRGSPINWLRPREEGEQFYVCSGSDSRHSTAILMKIQECHGVSA